MKFLFSMLSLLVCFSAAAQDAPPPKHMTIMIYQAGAKWMKDKPSQEQNLAGHFAYAAEQFRKGNLVAYGTQTDAVRGFYVLNTADPKSIQQFVDRDPAISKDKVLEREDALAWTVMINGFAPNTPGEMYYILRYKPGKNWTKGKSLMEQNIGAHFAYITGKTKDGVVIAGGPNTTADEGIYIIRSSDASSASAFVAADPGVTAGLFNPEIFGWNVLAMQSVK